MVCCTLLGEVQEACGHIAGTSCTDYSLYGGKNREQGVTTRVPGRKRVDCCKVQECVAQGCHEYLRVLGCILIGNSNNHSRNLWLYDRSRQSISLLGWVYDFFFKNNG